MRLFGRDIQGHAKVLVILVAVLLVASGLCGVQLALVMVGHGVTGGFDGIVIITGALELIAIALSAGGVVFILIWWPISVVSVRLYERFAKPPKDPTIHLFENTKDEEGQDEP